ESVTKSWRTCGAQSKMNCLEDTNFTLFVKEVQIESRANKAVAINMGAKINASAILYRMDKLDGTNEFYEFLGQMEDDTNE
ncbi:phage protein, partial [Staphylococcus aureus M0664]